MNRLKIEDGKLILLSYSDGEVSEHHPRFISEEEMPEFLTHYNDLSKQEKLILLEYLKMQVENE